MKQKFGRIEGLPTTMLYDREDIPSVAAGVILCGDQDEARTRRLWPRGSTEYVQDAEDGGISR